MLSTGMSVMILFILVIIIGACSIIDHAQNNSADREYTKARTQILLAKVDELSGKKDNSPSSSSISLTEEEYKEFLEYKKNKK